METRITGAPLDEHPGSVVRRDGLHLSASPEMLQAIVQAAYDQHGILAQPSYAAEAEGGAAATHAMAMAHNAGVRA